jgi:DNA repair exonuclease SbcCD nuclease subunit
MIRFIHTADWQIGMKAVHVGAAAEAVRSERLKAARRVVEAARERGVDFLLVAGDTFEDNAVDRVLVQKVADTLASFGGPVYVIPGNHDPLVPGSVWDHPAWQSARNVRVLTEAAPVAIEGGTLYPSPVFQKHSLNDPSRWINAQDATGIAIGIVHGTVEGVSQEVPDYPIRRDAAARSGLDYLALGHWHSAALFSDVDGASRMAYSGTHETTRFGERDSGNVLLVEVDRRGSPPQLTTVRTGDLRWESIVDELREPADVRCVREKIETWHDPAKSLIELRLSGIAYRESQAELLRIDEILKARFLYGGLDSSALVPAPDDDRWLDDVPMGVLREATKRLQALSSPAVIADRPDYARPEVAMRAMLELYRIIQETPK